jgi:hypothetical protein
MGTTRGLCGIALAVAALTACGPSPAGDADGSVTDEACGSPGETRCVGSQYQECVSGFWVIQQICTTPQVCDSDLSCVDCRPSDARTCVGDTVHECNPDGTVGDSIEECEFEQCSNGNCGGDDCVGGTDLIYVVDDTYRLLSFNPENDLNEFTLIGTLDCPAGAPWPDWQPGPATPFSMSVDRSGRAWVLYSSGEIFWVDVTDASCQPSGFTKGQSGFELFGMGFVSDSPGSAAETLYIAGGSSAIDANDFRLASVNPANPIVNQIGTHTAPETFGPELTGTGDAKLFGYYPGISTTKISEISKTNAANTQDWPMPGLGSQVRAWAFAHWGGRFYIFVTTTDGLGLETTSQVRLLDPISGNSNVIAGLEDIPYIIVGAGVSTCAPVVIE